MFLNFRSKNRWGGGWGWGGWGVGGVGGGGGGGVLMVDDGGWWWVVVVGDGGWWREVGGWRWLDDGGCGWWWVDGGLHFLHIFNIIFTQAKFPGFWNINTLTPLHKKGSMNVREKTFLSILHNRLYEFSEKHGLVPHYQIGYKKGLRTTDHILVFKNIIDKYIQNTQRKYLFACFVDFKSAFDTVWRDGMFYELLKIGIDTCFLRHSGNPSTIDYFLAS